MTKIPESWTETKIGAIAEINPSLPCKPEPSENVSFLGMTDIGIGKILTQHLRLAREIGNGFTPFVNQDVLVGKITPCFENGKGCLCSNLENGIGFGSTEFLVLRAKKNVAAAFLFHHVMSEKFRAIGSMNMVGSAGQKRVQPSFVRSYSIPLPPLSEQIEIARILGTWDDALSQLSALIVAKTQRKRALMQQLLSGARRFPEFESQTKRISTPCGNIPADWLMVKMKDVFVLVQRRNRGTTSRVLTASGRQGMIDQSTYFKSSVAGASIADYYLLERGEFAYNRSSMKGYPFGAIKRLDIHENGAVSTLYLCFALKRDDCDSDFYTYFFESGNLNNQLRAIAQMGARSHGLLNVTASDFLSILIPVPPLAEQKRIAQVLAAASQEITTLEKQRQVLAQQKRGLMQKLLSGEVRVTNL